MMHPGVSAAETLAPTETPHRDETLRFRVEELRAEAERAAAIGATSVSCSPREMVELCAAWQGE